MNSLETLINNTISTVSDIKKLDDKDVNIEFKKKYKDKYKGKEKWKQYLKLYQDCYNIFIKLCPNGTMSSEYIKALTNFSKNLQSVYSAKTNLDAYVKELIIPFGVAEEKIKMAKQINEEIIEDFSTKVEYVQAFLMSKIEFTKEEELNIKNKYKLNKKEVENLTVEQIIGKKKDSFWGAIFGTNKGKSVLLGEINEKRKAFADELDKISKKFENIRTDVKKIVGLLNKVSIDRNVFQIKENSPLKALKGLHDAISENADLPLYNGKDVLDMNKTLDSKVKKSMEKVINYDWENYANLRKKLGVKNLLESINRKKDVYDDNVSNLKKELENIKGDLQPEIVIDHLTKSRDGLEATIKADSGTDKVLVSLIVKLYSSIMSCEVITYALATVQVYLAEEIKVDEKSLTDFVYNVLIDQNPGKLKSLAKVFFRVLSVVAQFLPVAGKIVGFACETVGNALDTTSTFVGLIPDIKDEAIRLKKLIKDKVLIDD